MPQAAKDYGGKGVWKESPRWPMWLLLGLLENDNRKAQDGSETEVYLRKGWWWKGRELKEDKINNNTPGLLVYFFTDVLCFDIGSEIILKIGLSAAKALQHAGRTHDIRDEITSRSLSNSYHSSNHNVIHFSLRKSVSNMQSKMQLTHIQN